MSESTPPGHIETPRVALRWSEEGIVVEHALDWPANTHANQLVMALTRCERRQEHGFIGRLLKRPTRDEDWLIVELRAAQRRRLVLTARAPDPAVLEGLNTTPPRGDAVDYEALHALMLTARDLGGLVAIGAHTFTPVEDAPLPALPAREDGTEITDSDTLGRALESAPDGHILKLGPGDFTLPSALLSRDIQLLGSGADATRLELRSGASWGLQITGDGVLLRDLTLISASPRAPGVIQLQDANATLLACTIQAHSESTSGVGVSVRGASRLHIEACTLTHCHRGLVASDTSHVRIQRCELDENYVGAAFEDASEGTVAGNTLRAHSSALRLKGNSTVWVDANTFLDNSIVGVEIAAQARARLTRNHFEGGGRGVSVRTSYPVELEDNLCLRYDHTGILLGGPNHGNLSRNACHWNRNGIEATDLECDAVLHANTCSDNRQCGIRVGAGARLHVTENTCNDNDIGIHVDDPPGRDDNTPGPHLEHNRCDRNRQCGIRINGPATAHNNTCVDNAHNDIDVSAASTARITLHDNITS